MRCHQWWKMLSYFDGGILNFTLCSFPLSYLSTSMTTTAMWTWFGCSGWKGSLPKCGWLARRWVRSFLWLKVTCQQSGCFYKHRELKGIHSVFTGTGTCSLQKFGMYKYSGKKKIHHPVSVNSSFSSSSFLQNSRDGVILTHILDPDFFFTLHHD